jgi:hypothetical protein
MAKIKLGTVKTTQLADNYICFAPCYQANNSTEINDLSGKLNNLKFNIDKSSLSVAEAWTTSNRISTVYGGAASTAKGFFLPTDIINAVDFSKNEGIILLFTTTITTPTTNTGLVAQGSSTTDTGIRVGITTGNVLKPSFYSTTEQVYFPDSSALPAGTPVRVLLFFGGSGTSGLKYACYINEVSAQGSLITASTSGAISPVNRVEPLYFGMYKVSSQYTSLTAGFQNIHILKVENTNLITFSGLGELAMRYKMSPNTPITNREIK